MARDPPSLLAASELRDIPLKPNSVRHANITIIHPQLRDLILPLARGRVLYPRGTGIEEMAWKANDPIAEGDEDEGMDELMGDLEEGYGHKGEISGTTKPFAKLTFTPNCLTASRGVLAAGGQHGELYICDLPTRSRSGEMATLRPFHLSQTLSTRSINNSILILPDFPDEWAAHSEARRIGYIGRGNRGWEEVEGGGRAEGGEWVQSGTATPDTDDDEAMDLDEEDEDEDEIQEPRSPATYPNTVPFLHAPRIPGLPPSPTAHTRRASMSATAAAIPRPRSSSSREVRQSFSTYTAPPAPGQRGVQIVTSHPTGSRSSSMSSARPVPPRPMRFKAQGYGAADDRQPLKSSPEPRILVSNNDQTVKVYTLRPTPSPDSTTQVDLATPAPSTSSLTPAQRRQQDLIRMDRILNAAPRQVLPPAPTFFGGRLGWESVGMNEGLRSNVRPSQVVRTVQDPSHPPQGHPDAAWSSERRHLRPFTSASSITSSSFGTQESEVRSSAGLADSEERKLIKVGGAKFRTAINHSSVSPDLKSMVSVGDSTDVYLFEVLDGGREFRKIKQYSAATDSGFSTAWSRDGRKFAVASQDGQVTVWDHRSSQPLAIFYTSSESPQSNSHNSSPASPSFNSDINNSRRSDHRLTDNDRAGMILVDPITGDESLGASASGREAARVVKFSPEGSSRDLMVFSEENSNIHVIDAKTFHSHVVLPVPHIPLGPAPPPTHRTGTEGGTWGVAGVAFDPTGDWLYSGTERTVVEWDLRRLGGGEGGCWGMA